MANDFFTKTGVPSTGAAGTSSTIRSEIALIEAGFDKMPTLSGNGSKAVAINSGATALEAVAVTGTGSFVRATSPTLVTPVLGVATATSINKVTITAPATAATLTIADGKTLTASNTLTFTGTDGSTLAIGTGGTLGTMAYQTAANYALLNSPSFTTPTLGVATATSINKVTITQPATSATLTVANGKTLTASNTITFTATDGSTLAIGTGGTLGTGAYATIANYATVASPTFTGIVSDPAGAMRGIPQNAKTGAYTLVLGDVGKHISNTTGGFVIPANASVAFPIGTAVTFYNNSGSNQTISITSDTLRYAGSASTGSRTLAQYGIATALKVDTTVWAISGAGLS